MDERKKVLTDLVNVFRNIREEKGKKLIGFHYLARPIPDMIGIASQRGVARRNDRLWYHPRFQGRSVDLVWVEEAAEITENMFGLVGNLRREQVNRNSCFARPDGYRGIHTDTEVRRSIERPTPCMPYRNLGSDKNELDGLADFYCDCLRFEFKSDFRLLTARVRSLILFGLTWQMIREYYKNELVDYKLRYGE